MGFMAVASVFPMAYRGSTLSANHVAAMQVAEGVLDRLQATPYGLAIPVSVVAPVTVRTTVEDAENDTTFTPSVTFARGGATADPNAQSDVATVTVTWREGTGARGAGVTKSVVVDGGVCRDL